MKSIQSKIIAFILVYLLLLALIIGSVTIINANRTSKNDSEIIISESCNEQVMELNYQLKIIQHAVDSIYGCAADQLVSAEKLSDKTYLDTYTESIMDIAVDLANHTEGALSVYLRYNPNLVQSGTKGFFGMRKSMEQKLEMVPTTDILAYDSFDTEHIGWYYIPVQTGQATWVSPYSDQSIGKELISYVVPFFADHQLIGIIGMDIDFASFVDQAQDIRPYENSAACIVNLADRELYAGSDGELTTVPLDDSLYNILIGGNESPKLHRIKYDGVSNSLAYSTLSNNMKFVLMVPISEINKTRNYMILNIVVTTLVILALAILTALYVTKRIVKPLRELTHASEQFAEGKWDVSINCYTNDEVKRLTDSVLIMARKTQAYIDQLNQQAMRDGLTGVKNKTCYLDTIQMLKNQLANPPSPYAVVVFDVNNLKTVNDTYGHEVGDELIVKACNLICEVFDHSPVFRIGGDEFTVIMQNRDYEIKEALIARFEQIANHVLLYEDRDIVFSVACGMAVFPEEASNYEDLFALADERMYEKKSRMKQKALAEAEA